MIRDGNGSLASWVREKSFCCACPRRLTPVSAAALPCAAVLTWALAHVRVLLLLANGAAEHARRRGSVGSALSLRRSQGGAAPALRVPMCRPGRQRLRIARSASETSLLTAGILESCEARRTSETFHRFEPDRRLITAGISRGFYPCRLPKGPVFRLWLTVQSLGSGECGDARSPYPAEFRRETIELVRLSSKSQHQAGRSCCVGPDEHLGSAVRGVDLREVVRRSHCATAVGLVERPRGPRGLRPWEAHTRRPRPLRREASRRQCRRGRMT